MRIGGAALLSIATSLGCSIDHVSDELACQLPTDCASGFTCVGGYCVIATGSECPTGCTTCEPDTTTCRLDGSMSNNGRVTCPRGWNCDVVCATSNCAVVDCAAARSCTITCSGTSACDQVICGTGRCQVTCSGTSSCGAVDCQDACACDVTCDGPQSCGQASVCPDSMCTSGRGCSSQPASCSTC